MHVRVDHKGHEVKVEGVSLQQADSLQSEPTEKLPKRLSTYELMLLNCGKTLEHPLDCKESRPVSPKGNKP